MDYLIFRDHLPKAPNFLALIQGRSRSLLNLFSSSIYCTHRRIHLQMRRSRRISSITTMLVIFLFTLSIDPSWASTPIQALCQNPDQYITTIQPKLAYPGEFTRFTVCSGWRNRWTATSPRLDLRLTDNSNVETYFASFPAQRPNRMQFSSLTSSQDDTDLEADGMRLFSEKPFWIRKFGGTHGAGGGGFDGDGDSVDGGNGDDGSNNEHTQQATTHNSLLMPSFGKSVERFQLTCPPATQPIDVVCWNAYGEIPPNIKTSVADRILGATELVVTDEVVGQLVLCHQHNVMTGKCLEWLALEDSSFLVVPEGVNFGARKKDGLIALKELDVHPIRNVGDSMHIQNRDFNDLEIQFSWDHLRRSADKDHILSVTLIQEDRVHRQEYPIAVNESIHVNNLDEHGNFPRQTQSEETLSGAFTTTENYRKQPGTVLLRYRWFADIPRSFFRRGASRLLIHLRVDKEEQYLEAAVSLRQASHLVDSAVKVHIKRSSESPGKNTLSSFPSRLIYRTATSYRVEFEMTGEDCEHAAIASVLVGCRYFDRNGKISKCSAALGGQGHKDQAQLARVNHYKSPRMESAQCFYDLDISNAVRAVAMQATNHLLFDLELRLTIQMGSTRSAERREFAFLTQPFVLKQMLSQEEVDAIRDELMAKYSDHKWNSRDGSFEVDESPRERRRMDDDEQ